MNNKKLYLYIGILAVLIIVGVLSISGRFIKGNTALAPPTDLTASVAGLVNDRGEIPPPTDLEVYVE